MERKKLPFDTLAVSQKNHHNESTSKGQLSHKIRLSEGTCEPSENPEIAGKARDEPGKEPTSAPIYALSKEELGTLCEYLVENEKKGLIRK